MPLLRSLAAALLAAALAWQPSVTQAATIADDPHTAPPAGPTWVVTSRDTFSGVRGIALDAHDWLDSRGEELVVAELDPAGVAALARHVHEVEHRCGGFFAFSTRQEAEAFIAHGRAAEAMALPMGGVYTIDNHATVEPWLDEVAEDNLYDTIAALAAFQNRHYQSEHGRDAALWIRDQWQALAAGRLDARAELFEDCGKCATQPSVILTINGHELADEVVVIGGHLDSINWDDPWNSAQRAPGADDDASGIATMTEMIRIALDSGWQPKRTIKFMGYAAEELGLLGSEAIASRYAADGVNVVGVLQLDMTNYWNGTPYQLRIVSDNSNAALLAYIGELFDEYLAPRGFTRANVTCGYGCSDHASWTDHGYPAGMLFEPGHPYTPGGWDMGDFPYIHTADDTLANMGDTAAPTIPFAQLGLAFLGELGKTHGTVAPNDPPVADFTWSVDGRHVAFGDTSTDADGKVVGWHWDFGDGTSSNARNPQKMYLADGSYEVTLTVTDDGGLADGRTQTVATDDTLFRDGFEP
ncbi:MAG: M20/M25/M40 family metallo-hydrolase [Xanthomonadales bacterium]|nr:M20/M25/M40 family metallo-hydrolase [Xanthomonadales bacterium]